MKTVDSFTPSIVDAIDADIEAHRLTFEGEIGRSKERIVPVAAGLILRESAGINTITIAKVASLSGVTKPTVGNEIRERPITPHLIAAATHYVNDEHIQPRHNALRSSATAISRENLGPAVALKQWLGDYAYMGDPMATTKLVTATYELGVEGAQALSDELVTDQIGLIGDGMYNILNLHGIDANPSLSAFVYQVAISPDFAGLAFDIVNAHLGLE